MLTFREFDTSTDTDYEMAIAVHNACWPQDEMVIEEWKQRDATRDPKYKLVRFVVEDGAMPIGRVTCMEPHWSYKPNKWQIELSLHPDKWEHLAEAFAYGLDYIAEQGGTSIITATREDKEPFMQLYAANGFVQEMRYPISQLTVAEFDFAAYKSLPDHVRQQGIEIITLDTLMEDVDTWKQQIYELDNTISKDVPLPEPYTPPPFDQFWKQVLSNPAFKPEAWFLARDKATGELVGLTNLWVSPAQSVKVYTGLTGMRRAYRRRGIATALKVCAIQLAADKGFVTIETDNEENNPMYDLNMQLGFKPRPAWIDFKQVVDGA